MRFVSQPGKSFFSLKILRKFRKNFKAWNHQPVVWKHFSFKTPKRAQEGSQSQSSFAFDVISSFWSWGTTNLVFKSKAERVSDSFYFMITRLLPEAGYQFFWNSFSFRLEHLICCSPRPKRTKNSKCKVWLALRSLLGSVGGLEWKMLADNCLMISRLEVCLKFYKNFQRKNRFPGLRDKTHPSFFLKFR